MFDQILDLINQPPGSLIYHLIVLFAVEAALAISFGQWMRDRERSTARLTVAAVAIFAARALVLIASLLAWQGYLPRNVLLPPIERAVDTATILGVGWVFVTMDDPEILSRNFLPDVISAVLTGMLIAGFIGTYYYWFFAASGGQLFNGLWLDLIWSIMQIVLALAGAVWMLLRVRYVFDPLLKGILLIVLAASSAIHLVRTPLGDVASAVRIGELVAMPMFTAVAYRHVIEKLLHWDAFQPDRVAAPVYASIPVVPAPPLPAPAPAPAPPVAAETARGEETVLGERARPANLPPVMDLVEAVGGLLSTLDQAGIVREATRSVATALRADVCLLAVIDEEAQQAGVLGGYDNISQSYLPQTVLDLGTHPTIVNTLGRLRQMRLTTQRNLRELKDLYTKVGITHQGPAYIQPLVDKDDRIGVLIIGSPYSERLLSNEERNLLDRLSPLVTSALINAENYRAAREEGEKTATEEGERIANLADELTATTADLNDAQRQMDEMKAYIRDMHRQLEGARSQQEADQRQIEALQALAAEADVLRGEVGRLRINPGSDGAAIKQAQAEIQRLRDDNERLLQRVLTQKHEVEQARQQLPTRDGGLNLSAEQTSLQRELEEMRQALQSELISMRARLTQASIGQQEVSFLQDQLAAKAREAVTLGARLVESQAIIEALRDQIGSLKTGGQGLELLQERIAAQAKELEDLRAELAMAQSVGKAEAVRAQRDMDRFDRESTGQFQALLADRTTMIETLEAQLTERNRAIAELAATMSDVEKSLRNLERQLSHKTDEVAELQRSLAEARAQAQQQMAALEGQGRFDEEAQAQVQALEAQLAEKAKAVDVLEAQLQSAKESVASLELQLSETHQAVGAAIDSARQGDSHDEVIASIAQEIRTPMSSIMGYTELLLREQVGIIGSLQRKFLQRVKANTERMGVLLEDLIRITALDTGRMQLESEKVDVVYAVEETVMNVANQYREKGLTLRLTLADGLPSITADRDAVLQIIGHLLTNAALASPVEGEVELMATVQRESLTPAGGEPVTTNCLYIAVKDSGPGVAPEDHERVFMRKYRADNPLIEGLGDTGVSLSLAKALIDAHNGRVWLDSVKDQGTTFHVLLPLTPLKTGNSEA